MMEAKDIDIVMVSYVTVLERQLSRASWPRQGLSDRLNVIGLRHVAVKFHDVLTIEVRNYWPVA